MLSRFEGIVDPNCRNSTGLTPLMKAALQGRTRVAKSLISAGKKKKNQTLIIAKRFLLFVLCSAVSSSKCVYRCIIPTYIIHILAGALDTAYRLITTNPVF
jgi:ankyrin repeat protein